MNTLREKLLVQKAKYDFHDRMNDVRMTISSKGDVFERLDTLIAELLKAEVGITDIYADYSADTKYIRIDVAVDGGILVIVRNSMEDGESDIAYSVSKGKTDCECDFLADAANWHGVIKRVVQEAQETEK